MAAPRRKVYETYVGASRQKIRENQEASGLLAASVGLKSKAKKRLDEITVELGEENFSKK